MPTREESLGPSKCFFGYGNIKYLGFMLGYNELTPMGDKIDAILNMSLPSTKKQLRSYLGSANFYSKFIPILSNLTAPLTEMLKKNTPNKLEWDEDKLKKFSLIKDSLSKKPVLQLPDYNKTFYLRTDASNIGIVSVLLQEAKGKLMPVAYARRKLLSREANYSTVEKVFEHCTVS